MAFTIGEWLVHPQYGVGQVVKLEEREFEPGVIRSYYEISIPGGSTVWVPLDLSNSGVRKLAEKSEINLCRKVLESRASPLTGDARLRQSELVTRLKEGTIIAHCEVIRDLSDYIAHKPTFGSVSTFLQTIQDVLCHEWALVEGIPLSEAGFEINSLLEKSQATLNEEETK